ncbi:MAG: hypothetical protein F4X56_01065 [Gammaproteobacteria bacterium]|nr:hypothetical protein [Gammaproteobacteria bacterium]MYC24491.1 hypothetical protein [Gammaproteobacteria bacterium]
MDLRTRTPPQQTGLYGSRMSDPARREDATYNFLDKANALERVYYSHLGAVIVNLRKPLKAHLTVDEQLARLSTEDRKKVIDRYGTGNIILDAIAKRYGKPTPAELRKYWRTDQKPTREIVQPVSRRLC